MDSPLSLNRRHFTALAAWAALEGTCAGLAGATEPPALLVLGDSLSAEYGLRRGTGWVALLTHRLTQENRTLRVINASVSGDTTAGGRSRLPTLLKQYHPAIVVIELGANDALRGQPLDATRDNLIAMVRAAKGIGAQVLIIGMEMPPNYGTRYTTDFRRVFADVAREQKTALTPFLLKGVADSPNADQLFQADHLHPTEKAHPTMLDNVWPALRPMLPTH